MWTLITICQINTVLKTIKKIKGHQTKTPWKVNADSYGVVGPLNMSWECHEEQLGKLLDSLPEYTSSVLLVSQKGREYRSSGAKNVSLWCPNALNSTGHSNYVVSKADEAKRKNKDAQIWSSFCEGRPGDVIHITLGQIKRSKCKMRKEPPKNNTKPWGRFCRPSC